MGKLCLKNYHFFRASKIKFGLVNFHGLLARLTCGQKSFSQRLGKDNPERKPDPTVCRFGVGLTTLPCKKYKVTEMSTIEKIVDSLCPIRDEEDN